MSMLTDEARRIIEEGRDAFGPEAAVAERLRSKIRGQTTGSSSPTLGGSAAEASWVGHLGRTWSTHRRSAILVATLALAGLSTTMLVGGRSAAPLPTEQPPSAPAEVPDPGHVDPPELAPVAPLARHPSPEPAGSAPESSQVVARAAAPSVASPEGVPAATQKRASRPVSARSDTDSLEAETRILAAAQAALKRGDLRTTAKSLDEHERRFAGGLLGEERLTLRVRLLCAEDRPAEAKRVARALADAHPRSSHLASLRDSCVAQEGDFTAGDE